MWSFKIIWRLIVIGEWCMICFKVFEDVYDLRIMVSFII